MFHAGLALTLCLVGTLALGWLFGGGWLIWLACWLLVVNVVTFGYYGYDKHRARRQGRRVPEVVLHGLGALGGSPAAFLAMRCFRHKTLKGSFRILYWCIAVPQLALAAWLLKAIWLQ